MIKLKLIWEKIKDFYYKNDFLIWMIAFIIFVILLVRREQNRIPKSPPVDVIEQLRKEQQAKYDSTKLMIQHKSDSLQRAVDSLLKVYNRKEYIIINNNILNKKDEQIKEFIDADTSTKLRKFQELFTD